MKKKTIIVTEEQYKEAVENSKSFTQVLKYLGYSGNSNFVLVRNEIIRLGIDYSHFSRKGEGIPRLRLQKDATEYLRIWDKSKKICTDRIKKKLIDAGILEQKCSKCGLEIWLDAPIKIELHHKNGDKWDNRLENLETLCPNCHAYTENYRGLKNRKNG